MQVYTTQLKRCDLVTASGKIDSDTAPRLAEAFEAITAAGRFKIVFDMSEVEYISSSGLRAMMNVQQACKRWDQGEMLLAGVPQPIYKVLDIVGFTRFFKFYENATSAIGSF